MEMQQPVNQKGLAFILPANYLPLLPPFNTGAGSVNLATKRVLHHI